MTKYYIDDLTLTDSVDDLVITVGENTDNDYKGLSGDVQLFENSPDTTYGSLNSIRASYSYNSNSFAWVKRTGLIKFDLSALNLDSSIIKEAKLNLYLSDIGGTDNGGGVTDSTGTVIFRRITAGDWIDPPRFSSNNTWPGDPTWNEREHDWTAWDSPGCLGNADIDTTTFVSITLTTDDKLSYISVDVTDIIKQQVDSGNYYGIHMSVPEDSLTNDGESPGYGFRAFFPSKEGSDNVRPYLTLTLATPSSSSSSRSSSSRSSSSSSSSSSSRSSSSSSSLSSSSSSSRSSSSSSSRSSSSSSSSSSSRSSSSSSSRSSSSSSSRSSSSSSSSSRSSSSSSSRSSSSSSSRSSSSSSSSSSSRSSSSSSSSSSCKSSSSSSRSSSCTDTIIDDIIVQRSSSSSSSRSSSSSSSSESSSSSSRSSSSSSSFTTFKYITAGENAARDYFSTTRDAGLYQKSPNWNKGRTENIYWKHQPDDHFSEYVVIKFDLDFLNNIIYHHSDIYEARLFFRVYNSFGTQQIRARRLKKDWNEGTSTGGPANAGEVTWNWIKYLQESWDEGGATGSKDRFSSYTSVNYNTSGWKSIDVTQIIKDQYSSGVNYGIHLQPTSNASSFYYSAETTSQPYLQIKVPYSLSSSSSSRSSSSSSRSSSSRSSSTSSSSSSSSFSSSSSSSSRSSSSSSRSSSSSSSSSRSSSSSSSSSNSSSSSSSSISSISSSSSESSSSMSYGGATTFRWGENNDCHFTGVTEDTYLNSFHNTYNYGASETLIVGNIDGTANCNVFLDINFSNIEDYIVDYNDIVSAKLVLFSLGCNELKYTINYYKDVTPSLNVGNKDGQEATSGEMTWTYRSYDNVEWHDSTTYNYAGIISDEPNANPVKVITDPYGDSTTISLYVTKNETDITNKVKEQIQNRFYNGYLITPETFTDYHGLLLMSSEYPNGSYRPFIEITFNYNSSSSSSSSSSKSSSSRSSSSSSRSSSSSYSSSSSSSSRSSSSSSSSSSRSSSSSSSRSSSSSSSSSSRSSSSSSSSSRSSSSSSSSSSRSSSSSSSSRSSSSSSSSSESSSSSSRSSSSTSTSSSSSSSSLPGVVWNFAKSWTTCGAGKANSGTLASTYTNDDRKFILDEDNSTPGFCYLFTFEDVPNHSSYYTLHFKGSYRGADNHIVKIQVYNNDTTSYNDLIVIENSLFAQSQYANIQGEEYFDSTGILIIRIIHVSPGNDGHLLRINYFRLEAGSSSSSCSSSSSSSRSSSSKSSSSSSKSISSSSSSSKMFGG